MERKTIGIKMDVNIDKTIDMIAQKEGKGKSQKYREIIDEYFRKHPLTDAEKKLIEDYL